MRLTPFRAAFVIVLVGGVAACLPAANQKDPMSGDRIGASYAYKATLSGAQEVPPVATAGKGEAMLSVNMATNELTWKVSYSGLSSTVTAAHIHGPAAPGTNAGVIINLAPSGQMIEGSTKLTDDQIKQLNSGMWYVNIHTTSHPSGEIRGQIGFAR